MAGGPEHLVRIYREALDKIRASLLDGLGLDEPGVDTSTPDLAAVVARRILDAPAPDGRDRNGEPLNHAARECPQRCDVTTASDKHKVWLHGDCENPAEASQMRGSVMTHISQRKTFSQALAEQRPQRMMCLPCIAERKAAEQAGQPVESLPEVREAITMLGGAPHCYEHIQVQRNTGLVIPQ
ncbi:MAG TPA: hypothetical protein VEO01_40465 [Pseudonocardiaceae bacterium]|nr:hypothetical protein [Pseudonocardiaceae bacterium]